MEAKALKGQQTHSPGQSEATPQVVGTYKIKNYTESVMITDMCLRIEFYHRVLRFCPYRAHWWRLTTQGVALG